MIHLSQHLFYIYFTKKVNKKRIHRLRSHHCHSMGGRLLKGVNEVKLSEKRASGHGVIQNGRDALQGAFPQCLQQQPPPTVPLSQVRQL